MENFIGKIVKISGTDSWQRPFSVVGIVCGQKEGYRGERTIFSLIQLNGALGEVSVGHNGDTKITSTKLDPDVRTWLKDAYKWKVKIDALKEKFDRELKELEGELNGSLALVKEASGEMTSREFIDKIRALFQGKYPATGGHYSTRSFDVASWSPTQVTVEQSQDVDKWANPEKYSFLYREYDNSIHIRHDSKSYRDFCVRNAPPVIPELAKYCETEVEATLGDKEWLSVGRRYTFPIKYGYSIKSIEEIRQRVFGERTRPATIDDQIAAAEKLQSGGKEKSFGNVRER